MVCGMSTDRGPDEARAEQLAAEEFPGFQDVTTGRWRTPKQARKGFVAGYLAQLGDEHHTMDELYEYRMLYNAHAAQGWLNAGYPVVKSWRHSDGELCFGGGWFVVVATLPTGQVSNHYAEDYWPLFNVPDVELPPEYDGHTPQDAAVRLRAALEVPQRLAVSVDQVEIAEADLVEALEPEDEDAYKGMDTLDLAQHFVRIVLGSLQIAVQR